LLEKGPETNGRGVLDVPRGGEIQLKLLQARVNIKKKRKKGNEWVLRHQRLKKSGSTP